MSVGLSRRYTLSAAAAAADAARAGGKAAALARLAAVFPVPAFFVIAPEAFDAGGWRPEARMEAQAKVRALGEGPFAVRSSGLEEDGAFAAHAGQFLTELDVPAEAVFAAAERVWRSGFTESLAAYRRARGLPATPQPPAVIVQVMVRPRAAGVAFSADPVSGARNVVVISAVAGLADRLVSGEVDGDAYRLTTDGPTLAIAAEPAGATPVLSEADVHEIAALARRAEAFFGAPQDVEWAIGAQGLQLLQSRPITTLPVGPPEPAPGPAPPTADADPALTIWDNANIVESYSGVTSALTFSFASYVYAHVYRAFARLMGVAPRAIEREAAAFENMLGRVDGRVYYNLLNWYRALALFPGFASNRAFMEQMMGVAEALPPALARALAPPAPNAIARLADRARLARVGLGLIAHALSVRRTVRRFYARLNDALARPDAEIATAPASALAAEYRRLEQQLLTRWDAPLVNDFLCMIAFGASRKLLGTWAGQAGLALHADMMIGQGDIISAEPARMIRAMGRMAAGEPALVERLAQADRGAIAAHAGLQAAFTAYLAKFGDRCAQELKLESRTLHEDPTPALLAIAAAARAPERPPPANAALTAAMAARLQALLPGRPLERWAARLLLGWTKARVRDRENLRFERTRLFGRVRRIMLALGDRFVAAGLLSDRRDVFHLTVEEILGAVEGAAVTADLLGLVALRRREDAESGARPDPPERFEIRGAHLVGVAQLTAPAAAEAGDETLRRGLACCAGVVVARVRVIDDPRTQALEPGEILVARHTDPGWIAIFANAAGVIAERGSLLSHSAIVAREMGVPCVVALKGAAAWLRTGDRVRLDGGAGVVEKLP